MRFSWPVRFTLWPSPYTRTRAQGALYREELRGRVLVQSPRHTPEGCADGTRPLRHLPRGHSVCVTSPPVGMRESCRASSEMLHVHNGQGCQSPFGFSLPITAVWRKGNLLFAESRLTFFTRHDDKSCPGKINVHIDFGLGDRELLRGELLWCCLQRDMK